ncbi:FAD dependent oxidoreductase [Penicillium waksmanii]|uniref:FAD dependent oxidoreductase n=1 Tax=Penicillium waksmanii TaxID=69791 RepID=UPI0025493FC8|nr:FAD dependent oxidoreductase [Penicillium waksmanii]KAJ5974563.1 FAD dependent oxidoreductase [Penicillium waksmanii]
MPDKHIPVPNGMLPFWRTEPHVLDNHRSTENLPDKCDIVIVGAGYAGASIAHHILRQVKPGSTPPSITILEARQACSGATARNGGHVKPDIYNFVSTLATDYGFDAAAEVANFEAKHVYAIKEFVEKEKIDCNYTVTKAIDVQLDPNHYKKLKKGFHELVANGCAATKLGQYVDAENAEAFSGVKGALGCFSYDSGHIWAYKFVLHLLEKVVTQGVNLQTHTPVSNITKSNISASTHPWVVDTQRGFVVARTVVMATNAYTSALVPQYQGKIVPVRGTCSRIVVPPGSSAPRLKSTYTLRWGGWEYDYLIPRGDGSIVVGGARKAFIHDLNSWYNVSDDSYVLEPAIRYWDGYMQRNFAGWEYSNAYTDRVWTGIMGYSSDGLPHIGSVPGEQNQYILAGFTGHGMPQIFLAAEGLAKMIMKGVAFEETGLPRLFKTSQARLDDSKSKIFEQTPNSGRSEAKL